MFGTRNTVHKRFCLQQCFVCFSPAKDYMIVQHEQDILILEGHKEFLKGNLSAAFLYDRVKFILK